MASRSPAVSAVDRTQPAQQLPDLARHWAYAAADQALAPVREWFESNWSLKEPDFDALARLIYTTEELSDGE